jgi:hypothetical protein
VLVLSVATVNVSPIATFVAEFRANVVTPAANPAFVVVVLVIAETAGVDKLTGQL